jgi:hypothetical protein
MTNGPRTAAEALALYKELVQYDAEGLDVDLDEAYEIYRDLAWLEAVEAIAAETEGHELDCMCSSCSYLSGRHPDDDLPHTPPSA